MALSNQLVAMPPFFEQLWDKDLNIPLAAGVVTFYSDSDRTVGGLKDVYTLTGTGPGTYAYVSLGNTLTLSGIGTFVDGSGNNVVPYLYPYEGDPNSFPTTVIDNYYITIYSQNNVLEFTVQNWPGIQATSGPLNESNTTDNVLSNPEFSTVLFPTQASMGTPYTYNTAGALVATPIAPNWDVITTGSGSFSVYQLAVSDTTVSTNPSYALVISGSSGYSQPLLLRQRLYNTARIFAQDYVNGTMSVAYLSGTIPTITMSYIPSATGTPETIVSGLLSITGYTVITGNSVMITPTNTGAVPSAYIDITISIPVGTGVAVTAVQICGVSDASETVAYTQSTNARQTDHLFHYYEPQLLFKPISSLLTGWDFALNPQQFVNSASPASITTTPAYIWDQLICASAVNTITTTTNANTFGFSATTTVNTDAFYMLQYLQNDSAVKTSMSNLAVNVNAYSATNPGVKVRVYLFYNNGGGTVPVITGGSPTTIGIVASTGIFTLSALNWTQVPQTIPLSGVTDYPITINQTTNPFMMDFPFVGFTGGSNFNTVATPNFAIVVTFAVPTSGTTVNVNSISLVPGDIATRPAPQTTDEVLRESMYYYSKSFATNVFPQNNPTGGISNAEAGIVALAGGTPQNGPIIVFPVELRKAPTMTYFNPSSGTAGQIYNPATTPAGTPGSWSGCGTVSGTLGTKGVNTGGLSQNGGVVGNIMYVHYTADARLGVVT